MATDSLWNVIDIMRGTTVDGPGFRTAIYLAGCSHGCRGCHNPQSRNPETGNKMSLDEILNIVREENFDVTLTGGDPLFNPSTTGVLAAALKKDGRNVWVYTGYEWEEIVSNPILRKAIEHADVVVDGPFVEELKDPDLIFRGSSNQRLINVAESLSKGETIMFVPEI